MKKFALFTVAMLLVCFMTLTLAACGTTYSRDTVLEKNTTISGTVTVKEGASLIIPQGVTVQIDGNAKFKVSGNIELRGTMRLKNGEWKSFFDGSSGTLSLHKGCNLFIGDDHFVGDEGDYSASILLGKNTYAAYEAGEAVMKIDGGSDSVVIAGKVYLNKTISDDRYWDLGYDSAAVLYADQNIKFKSVRNADKPVTASVYTYGGKNTASSAKMENLHADYVYIDNKWTDTSGITYYGYMMNVLPSRSSAAGTLWNGSIDYDTEAGEDGQRIANLKYTERNGNRNVYDLWLPKNIVDGKNKDKDVKVILFVHGGSWSSGKKEDVSVLCAMYAKMGYVTATVNYRLTGQALAIDTGTYQQMIEDIYDCVGAIKTELSSRGYNATGMAISGQSAGGHLAMLYAGRHYETAEKPSPIPVKLVLDEFGPTGFTTYEWANNRTIWVLPEKLSDWARLYPDQTQDPNWEDKRAIAAWLACLTLESNGIEKPTEEEFMRDELNPETVIYKNLAQISPSLNWGEGKCMIPVVGIHGEADTTVSVYGTYLFQQKLNDLGIDNKFVITPVNGHMQAEDETAYSRYYDFSKEYLQKYLPLN